MRWPIQIQLLLPMLTVVVMAIVLAAAVTAYLGGKHARQAQDDNLRRVLATLSEANFPLSEPVLRQMSGLSGAEFVFFVGYDSLQAATLRLDNDDLKLLRSLLEDKGQGSIDADHATSIAGRVYLTQHVSIRPRYPFSQGGSLVVLYPQDRWWSAARQAAYPAYGGRGRRVRRDIGHYGPLAPLCASDSPAWRSSRGHCSGRFPDLARSRRNDEIRDLTLSINQMALQLGRYENDVRRNEQLRTLGKLGRQWPTNYATRPPAH